MTTFLLAGLAASGVVAGLGWWLLWQDPLPTSDERSQRLARLVEAWRSEASAAEPPMEARIVERRIEVRVRHTLKVRLTARGADDPDTAVTGLRTDFDRDHAAWGEDRLLLSRKVRELVALRMITIDAHWIITGGDVLSLPGLRTVVADLRELHALLHRPVPEQLVDIIRSGDDVWGRRQALERLLRDHPGEVGRLEGFEPPPELALVLHVHRGEWDAMQALFRIPRLPEALRQTILTHLAAHAPQMLAIAPDCAASPALSAAWFAHVDTRDPRVAAGLRELLRGGLVPKERHFQVAAAAIVVGGPLSWTEGDVPLLLQLLGLVEPQHRMDALAHIASCATMEVAPMLREAARTKFLPPKAVEAALEAIRGRRGQAGALSLVDPIAGEVSLATGGGTLREPDAEPS